MAKQILNIGADDLFRFDGAKDKVLDSFLNAATVTAVLKDSGGTPVPGADSITLSYVAGSDGRYDGIREASVALVKDADYSLEITLTEGVLEDFRIIPCIAKDRGLV